MLGPSLLDDQDSSQPSVRTAAIERPQPLAAAEVPSRWDRTREILAARGFTAFVWVCSVGLLALVSRPLLLGLVPIAGDAGALFLPLREFYAESLARGESFDWMPQLLSGYPTAGSELGPYHPARFLAYRLLRIDVAYALELSAPSLAWFVGLQLFLRPWVGRGAAAFAALLATFSYTLLYWIEWPHAAAILAHIPWILWSMRFIERARPFADRLLGMGLLALLTGSQYLLAHPQSLWFSLLTVFIYAVFLAVQGRLEVPGFAGLAAAQVLAAMIGAVQTYAMYAALGASTRSAADAGLTNYGALRPLELVSTLLPAIHWGRQWTDLGTGTYLGIVPVALCVAAYAVLGATPRKDSLRATIPARPRAALAWFGAVLALFALWMALGYDGYLYRLQGLLPAVGKLRAPQRFTILTHLGFVVIGSVVVARLLDRVRARTVVPWSRLFVPWLVAIAAIGLGAYAQLDDPSTKLQGFQASYLTGPLILCAATLAITIAGRGRVLGLYALVAVVLFELVSYNLLNPHLARLWRDETPRWREWLDSLPQPPDARPGRIFVHDFFGSQLLLTDARLVNGYAGGLEVRRQLDYAQTEALRVASAAWVYHRHFDPLPDYAGLTAVNPGWYAVPNPLPRVRLVQNALQTRTPARDLTRTDLATTALVRRRIQLYPGPHAGQVRVIHDRPGRLGVEATTYGTELLVFAETFERNWQARVNGKRVRLERVNGDFMGCVVRRGTHQVRFEYRPERLWLAEKISVTGAGLTLLLTAIAWFHRRRRARLTGSS